MNEGLLSETTMCSCGNVFDETMKKACSMGFTYMYTKGIFMTQNSYSFPPSLS
jgi:hypothetical protein